MDDNDWVVVESLWPYDVGPNVFRRLLLTYLYERTGRSAHGAGATSELLSIPLNVPARWEDVRHASLSLKDGQEYRNGRLRTGGVKERRDELSEVEGPGWLRRSPTKRCVTARSHQRLNLRRLSESTFPSETVKNRRSRGTAKMETDVDRPFILRYTSDDAAVTLCLCLDSVVRHQRAAN